MRRARALWMCAVLTMVASFACAQDVAEPVFLQGFEENTDGVEAMNPMTTLERTNAAGEAHDGNWALKLTYPENVTNETQVPVVAVPQIGGVFGGLRFWARASDPSVLGCMAQERDGSSYASFVSVPANTWLEVIFDRHDFFLDDKTVDENGYLDGDQVVGVGFGDVTSLLFGQAAPGGGPPLAVGAPPLAGGGQSRNLWVDAIEVHSEPLRVLDLLPDGILIDDFNAVALRGLFMGDGAVESAPREDGDEDDMALLARYSISQDQLMAGIMHPLPPTTGVPFTGLRFDAKADFPGTFLIGVTEQDDSQYFRQVEPELTTEWQTIEVLLTGFNLSDDSTDENGRLDPEQIKAVMFGDASGIMGTFGVNGLWMDNLTILTGP